LQRLAATADLILYDIKHIDDTAHRRWTGVSNRPILDNATRLAAGGHNVQIRLPLIPDVNDDEESLRRIFDWLRHAGLTSVALLPYNPAAAAKYDWLDLPHPPIREPQTPEQLARLLALAREAGLNAELNTI